ncbi:unnamed protein product, partial [Heterotrigona itama]
NNFYPVILYRRWFKRNELLYTVCGHSLWSVNQLPAQK